VRVVDGDESSLSEAALALVTAGGGVGRPADADTLAVLLGLWCDRIDPATGKNAALFVVSGISGTIGSCGLLCKAGTKNGLGFFTSDGAGEFLILSLD
jgi:hypothetical protein